MTDDGPRLLGWVLVLAVVTLAIPVGVWFTLRAQPIEAVPVPVIAPTRPLVAVTYELTGSGQARIALTDASGLPVDYGWQRLPMRASVTTAGAPFVTVASPAGITVGCRVWENGRATNTQRARGSVTCDGGGT